MPEHEEDKRKIEDSSADQIKEYGRRARARTEEQRKNRKAIQVIDDSASFIAAKIPAFERKPASHANGSRKRKRPHHYGQGQNLPSNRGAQSAGRLVWTPDLSLIPQPPEELRSNFVHLHGLPAESTLETVRRFFAGLVPERILFLLSNKIYIRAFDASSYQDLWRLGLRDSVCTNKDARVLVRFESVAAARLAADRSGETLSSNPPPNRRGIDDPVQDVFSIGVTAVSKQMAASLSKLCVDAVPGVSFIRCLADIQLRLDPKVKEILWTSVGRACKVPVDGEMKTINVFVNPAKCEVKAMEHNTMEETGLLTFAEYRRHADHYNRLLGIEENLMASIEGGKADYDASNSMDPIVLLTFNACMVINDEMDRIDTLLHQHRVARNH